MQELSATITNKSVTERDSDNLLVFTIESVTSVTSIYVQRDNRDRSCHANVTVVSRGVTVVTTEVVVNYGSSNSNS